MVPPVAELGGIMCGEREAIAGGLIGAVVVVVVAVLGSLAGSGQNRIARWYLRCQSLDF